MYSMRLSFLILSCCRQEVEVESTETTKTTPEIKEKTVEDVKAKKEEASSNFFPIPHNPIQVFRLTVQRGFCITLQFFL